jgi:hypothetical protein
MAGASATFTAANTIGIDPTESVVAAQSEAITDHDGETGYDTNLGVQRIEKDPEAGFHSPYFLYTPSTQTTAEDSVNGSQTRPLLVRIYPYGDHQNRVQNARRQAEAGWIADAVQSPLLVAPLWFRIDPGFGLESGEQVSDPRRERVDLQLLAMIEDAKSRLNGGTYTVADQIHFEGSSAKGTFIDRFAALHPEHVNVFSSGANGIAFLPVAEVSDELPTYNDATGESISWPFGTANFEDLVGEEFNREAWMDITQFQWIGENDQDPSDPDEYVHKAWRFEDEDSRLVQEIFGTLQVDHRFNTCREIYNHLGVPATFTIFDGSGHVPGRDGRQQIAQYHMEQVVENFDVGLQLEVTKSASRIQAGDSVTVTVTAQIPIPVPVSATTTITIGIDGEIIKTATPEISRYDGSSVEVTQTFDQPGTYTFTVNGNQIEDGEVTVVESTSTPTPTPTSTPPSTQTSTQTASTQTEASTPGFGIGGALAGIAGLFYWLTEQDDK